ncbi:MAG TPA: hypothetical protein VMW20_05100, partial [Candidatus Nanoarchaeia archaeon]|nr:hypothetical protein [Candidatus Nanoarchaeia archaeon]
MSTSVNAAGLLHVHPTNPRYFTDDTGDAIRLGGHQIFVDNQDNIFSKTYTYNYQTLLDWDWYMGFMNTRNLNYIRSWSQLSTTGGTVSLMPYERVSGYGNANDGGLKFDLTKLNQAYFDRMYARILDAQNHGVYVSIMLFDIYSFGYEAWDDLWMHNVFNGDNNMNGINVDANSNGFGDEFFSAPSGTVLALQQAYVAKVINTVNSLDNVFYEIANEVLHTQWQYDMIDYIQAYEAGKAQQHMTYMSYGWAMTVSQLMNSGADVWAPGEYISGWSSSDPPIYSTMPVIWDADHIWPADWATSRQYAWKSFMRGFHYSLYDQPFEAPAEEDADWENIRYNIGATVSYSNAMDLANMEPSDSAADCSTTFCLINAGQEYLVYQPGTGAFTVDVSAGEYDYEWFRPSTAAVYSAGDVTAAGGSKSFTPPFAGDAVLYLKLDTSPPDPDTWYVTQNGAGARTGTSLLSAMSVVTFNALTGSGYMGDTFYFSGPFTTTIAPQGSMFDGTSGNPVTLDGYESGNCDPVGDITICDGSGDTSAQLNAGMYIAGDPSYTIIQDFGIRQAGTVLDNAFTIQPTNGYDHFIFRRNHINDTSAIGLRFGYSSAHYGGTDNFNQYVIVEDNRLNNFGMRWIYTAEVFGESTGIDIQHVQYALVRRNVFGHDNPETQNEVCINDETYDCRGANTVAMHWSSDVLFEYNDI